MLLPPYVQSVVHVGGIETHLSARLRCAPITPASPELSRRQRSASRKFPLAPVNVSRLLIGTTNSPPGTRGGKGKRGVGVGDER